MGTSKTPRSIPKDPKTPKLAQQIPEGTPRELAQTQHEGPQSIEEKPKAQGISLQALDHAPKWPLLSMIAIHVPRHRSIRHHHRQKKKLSDRELAAVTEMMAIKYKGRYMRDNAPATLSRPNRAHATTIVCAGAEDHCNTIAR